MILRKNTVATIIMIMNSMLSDFYYPYQYYATEPPRYLFNSSHRRKQNQHQNQLSRSSINNNRIMTTVFDSSHQQPTKSTPNTTNPDHGHSVGCLANYYVIYYYGIMLLCLIKMARISRWRQKWISETQLTPCINPICLEGHRGGDYQRR